MDDNTTDEKKQTKECPRQRVTNFMNNFAHILLEILVGAIFGIAITIYILCPDGGCGHPEKTYINRVLVKVCYSNKKD